MPALKVIVTLILVYLLSFTALRLESSATAQAQSVLRDPASPEVGARVAIVVEFPSGRILYEKSSHERMPPASLTKILTAIMALEYGNLDDTIEVTADDMVGESSMGLQVGERQTLRDLLYGLMLPSGNDAAMVIARSLGSKVVATPGDPRGPIERFSEMMNVRARQLGLGDSHFVNPHGLDGDGHYSTAYDLASMTWYALHIPMFLEVVKQVSYEAPGRVLLNTNEMLTRYPGADGVKTGWTDGCGLCLVTTAERNGKRLISVVLDAPNWYGDSGAILDYGFAKLAAQPDDASAERLSVSQRGMVSWLLVNAAPAPPMPIAVPEAIGKGGGPAPDVNAPAGGAGIASAAQSSESGGASILLAGKDRDDASLWSLILFGMVGAAGLFLLSGKLFMGRSAAAVRGPLLTHVRPPQPAQPQIQVPRNYSRTLGTPHGRRRREPNLLDDGLYRGEAHAQRAIALGREGRQGSSMSEFSLAMRLGYHFDVAELCEQHSLNATTFLALARAQLAAGDKSAARKTLIHAGLVLPDDRILRLALEQIKNR